MSVRAAGTRRPRLLPAALLASGLVVATAATALAVTARPDGGSAQSCAAGREWVTVHPIVITADWKPARVSGPSLYAGCVDTRQLAPTEQTDARG